jgi:hypothetical protein
MLCPDIVKDVFDRIALAFMRNEDAGVEDQTQGLSPMPKYRAACDWQ